MGRFRRVAEAFDVAARDCDSSGSEHSTNSLRDLSDMVNSFIKNGDGDVDSDFVMRINDECNSDGIDDDMEEMKESLKALFRSKKDDAVRKNLLIDVEKAWWRVTGDNSSPSSSGSKRLLMSRLRDQGLDAGPCKSKWEKKGRLISGDYQYVDVNVDVGFSRAIITTHSIQKKTSCEIYQWIKERDGAIFGCIFSTEKETIDLYLSKL